MGVVKLKVLIYTDIHSSELELMEDEYDAIFLLGDIDWRDVKRIDAHYQCPKFGVLGNHDKMDTFIGTSVIDMHQNIEEFKGFTLAGFSGSPRYNGKERAAQFEEEEVATFVDCLKQVDIFLAHSNPSFSYSSDKTDGHRGFVAYGDLIAENRVKYFLHGHLHLDGLEVHGNTEICSVYLSKEKEFRKNQL